MRITSDILKFLSTLAVILFLLIIAFFIIKDMFSESSIRNDERKKTVEEINDGEEKLQQARDVAVLKVEKKLFERDKKLEKETDPIKRATIIFDSWEGK